MAMSDKEILDAIRNSGITGEQLAGLLTKNVVLVRVEEKRAEMAAVQAERVAVAAKLTDEATNQLSPYAEKLDVIRAELNELEKQAAITLAPADAKRL